MAFGSLGGNTFLSNSPLMGLGGAPGGMPNNNGGIYGGLVGQWLSKMSQPDAMAPQGPMPGGGWMGQKNPMNAARGYPDVPDPPNPLSPQGPIQGGGFLRDNGIGNMQSPGMGFLGLLGNLFKKPAEPGGGGANGW